MMGIEFLRIISHGLRYRGLRSWLTVLGIVLGIMLVVIIIALGNGVQRQVQQSLRVFGPDLIAVFPGKENNLLLGMVGGARFQTTDLEDLSTIPGVDFSMPVDQGVVTAEYKGDKQSVLLHAQNWEHYIEIVEESEGQKLKAGRYPSGDDVSEVAIGYSTAETIFHSQIHVGDDIILKAKRFTVVGIFESLGEQNHDSAVFISYDAFRSVTGNQNTALSAIVRVLPDADPKIVAQEVRHQLAKQSVVEDFTVLTPDKANALVDNVLGVIEIALMIIALVSLAVGGVGVMNTMYTSVLERTKHIGVMKAIGATHETIITLFLIESGAIGMIGGFLGIILGLLAASGIGAIAANLGVRGLFSWSSIDYVGMAALLTFTFIIGIIAGFLPARAAGKLEPAEALRYE